MARKTIPSSPTENYDGEREKVDGKAPTDHVNKDLPVEEDGKHGARFGEPIAKEYPTGEEAEIVSAANKPAETVVEHPLAPTDTNPNPHGTRDTPQFTSVPIKDEDGKVHISRADDGVDEDGKDKGVEVEGTSDHHEGVHIGDGRILAKGERMKVSKETAKALVDGKHAKRV